MADVAQSATGYRSPSTKLPTEYHELILNLRDELKKSNVISRVEYVGSAFKNTRIDGSDMDNLFVKRDGTIRATPSHTRGECAFLEQNGSKLNPRTTLYNFKGKVQMVLNHLGLAEKTKLADHGPAIELRHYQQNSWRTGARSQFAVDLVFCYEIPDVNGSYKMYVAKPPRDAVGEELYLWKLSTSLEEKRMMSTIDKDNKIRRWAVRVMKALRDHEPNLHVLTSYVFEQALYHLKDKYADEFWKEGNIKEIIRVLLEFVADVVEKGEMLNFFNRQENVIPRMNDATRENIVQRLRRLSRDPHLQRLLDTV